MYIFSFEFLNWMSKERTVRSNVRNLFESIDTYCYIVPLREDTSLLLSAVSEMLFISDAYKHWRILLFFWRLFLLKRLYSGSSRHGTVETNPTGNHEVEGSIPGLSQWVKDPVLLWLWCRPAATALIRPLAWKPPHAAGLALKGEKDKKKIIFRFSKVCVLICISLGVPAVAQWVKNLTAAVWIAVEVGVWSLGAGPSTGVKGSDAGQVIAVAQIQSLASEHP